MIDKIIDRLEQISVKKLMVLALITGIALALVQDILELFL